MDLQDLNVAVAEIRGNVDRNTGRIKDLEKKTDAVAKLAEAVAVMAEHMKTRSTACRRASTTSPPARAKTGTRWSRSP